MRLAEFSANQMFGKECPTLRLVRYRRCAPCPDRCRSRFPPPSPLRRLRPGAEARHARYKQPPSAWVVVASFLRVSARRRCRCPSLRSKGPYNGKKRRLRCSAFGRSLPREKGGGGFTVSVYTSRATLSCDKPPLFRLRQVPHAAREKALRSAELGLPTASSPERQPTAKAKEKAPHCEVKCNSSVSQADDQISTDSRRVGMAGGKMAGKDNLPKPPQLAHAFAYRLLTLYHSLPRLSIASREKFRAPSAAYFSVSLPCTL